MNLKQEYQYRLEEKVSTQLDTVEDGNMVVNGTSELTSGEESEVTYCKNRIMTI
jgi:hypothetical protein